MNTADRTDIATKEDIRLLVDRFYTKVKQDKIIGYIFTDVVPISWEHHMPVMYGFWETVLLGQVSYKGNPILKHIDLDKKEPLTEQHFDRWLQLWNETIDEHFEGATATLAKQKGQLMKHLMLTKIAASRKPGFIQ